MKAKRERLPAAVGSRGGSMRMARSGSSLELDQERKSARIAQTSQPSCRHRAAQGRQWAEEAGARHCPALSGEGRELAEKLCRASEITKLNSKAASKGGASEYEARVDTNKSLLQMSRR